MDKQHVYMLVTMMESDHRRQLALLNRIGKSLEEGYTNQLRQALDEFAVRLYKHIKIENHLLGQALGMPAEGPGLTSLDDLEAEHAELLAKLAMVEGRLDERARDDRLGSAWRDFTTSFALHEQEEERHLFPYWQKALVALPEEASATLYRRVRETHLTSL